MNSFSYKKEVRHPKKHPNCIHLQTNNLWKYLKVPTGFGLHFLIVMNWTVFKVKMGKMKLILMFCTKLIFFSAGITDLAES